MQQQSMFSWAARPASPSPSLDSGGGLDDDRGQLALEFLRLADRLAPRWIVWENVPGVLSADRGRAFGAFLGGLAELGYGWAYRVLDAQFFGLAQRRKRVFVVGCARGEWQRAAAVLLERSGLRGDPAPSRETGARVAGCLEARAGRGGPGPDAHGAASGHLVASALKSTEGKSGPGIDGAAGNHIVAGTLSTRADRGGFDGGQGDPRSLIPIARTITTREGRHHDESVETLIPFDTAQLTSAENRSRPEAGDPSPTLARRGAAPAIAFHQTQDPIGGEISPALGRTTMGMGMGMGSTVRRLTPRECERLMGFDDDYTAISWLTKRGKVKHAEDGPRYAALGNSIAVPKLRWIGRRIAFVDQLARAS